MAEPSLLKCNSLAMAYILGEGVLVLSKRLRLAAAKEEREEIEEDDDSLWNLLSKRGAAGGAKEPAEDMAANVDAITPLTYFVCYSNTQHLDNLIHKNSAPAINIFSNEKMLVFLLTKNKKTATAEGPGLAFRV